MPPPESQASRPIRVAADLADMLGWINEIEGDTAAEVVEPLVRKHIEDRFARIKPAVDAIKAAKAKYQPAGA